MKRWLSIALRWALAGVFVYAGVVKLTDSTAFAEVIRGYRVLPEGWAVSAAAFYLPWLEVVCGLALLPTRCHRAAAVMVSGLMAVFILALLSAWWRGLNIRCGCFGSASDASYPYLLGRDLLILAVGVSVVVLGRTPSSTNGDPMEN